MQHDVQYEQRKQYVAGVEMRIVPTSAVEPEYGLHNLACLLKFECRLTTCHILQYEAREADNAHCNHHQQVDDQI